jgi:hypothetical protein
MCPQINKPKLKFYNNLGLDSLSPDQELDPRVPHTQSRNANLSDMFSDMWLLLQKYSGGAREAVQRMHGRGWSMGIPFSNIVNSVVIKVCYY